MLQVLLQPLLLGQRAPPLDLLALLAPRELRVLHALDPLQLPHAPCSELGLRVQAVCVVQLHLLAFPLLLPQLALHALRGELVARLLPLGGLGRRALRRGLLLLGSRLGLGDASTLAPGGSVAHTPLSTHLGTNMGLSMGCGAASALDVSDSVSDSVSVSVSVPGSSGAAPSVTAGGGRAGPRAWGPDTGANPDGRAAGTAGSADRGDAAAAGADAGSSSESVSARVSEAPHRAAHTIFTQVLGHLLCVRALPGLRQLNRTRAPLDRHAGRRRRLDCMARQRRRGDLLRLLLGPLGHIRVRLVLDLGRRRLPGAVASRGTRHARAAHAVASSRRRSLRMYCQVEVCTTDSTSLTRGGNAPSGWPSPPRRRPTARGCSARGARPTDQSRAGRAR